MDGAGSKVPGGRPGRRASSATRIVTTPASRAHASQGRLEMAATAYRVHFREV
jgi:hypothetical protein